MSQNLHESRKFHRNWLGKSLMNPNCSSSAVCNVFWETYFWSSRDFRKSETFLRIQFDLQHNNWNYRVCSWTSLQLGSMVSKQSRTSYTEENDALPFNDFFKKTPNKNKNKNKKYLYDKYRFNKIMFLSSKLQSLNRYCSVKCL